VNNLEKDYVELYDPNAVGKFVSNTNIEIMREIHKGAFSNVLFDFDGTLSLIREGWQSVMSSLMFEVLSATPKAEGVEELKTFIDDLILRTTGKQTIYQMIDLVGEVEKRGGNPLTASEYKAEYSDRLMVKINDRREALRNKTIDNTALLVPGTLDLLNAFKEKGITMYLASGTDSHFVKEEASLLGVDVYFGEHIYGALEDYKSFSKAMVIEKLLKDNNLEGNTLLGFGDGFVEIENVKSFGGTAVGIAIDEKKLNGAIDPIKRSRLLGVGADIIVPDYNHIDELMDILF